MFYRIMELDIALQKYTFVISKSNNRLVRRYEASPMKPSFMFNCCFKSFIFQYHSS